MSLVCRPLRAAVLGLMSVSVFMMVPAGAEAIPSSTLSCQQLTFKHHALPGQPSPSITKSMSCSNASGPLTIEESGSEPANHGTVTTAAGDVTYDPTEPEFSGWEMFRLLVTDGIKSGSVWATVEYYRNAAVDVTATGPTTVQAGTEVTFVATATNIAKSTDPTKPSIRLDLPDHTEFVSASRACTTGSGFYSVFYACSVGVVDPGESASLTVTVRILPGASSRDLHFWFMHSGEFLHEPYYYWGSSALLVVNVTPPSGVTPPAAPPQSSPGAISPNKPPVGKLVVPRTLKLVTLLRTGALGTRHTKLKPNSRVIDVLQLKRPNTNPGRRSKRKASYAALGRGEAVANARGVAKVRIKVTSRGKRLLRQQSARKVLRARIVTTVTDPATGVSSRSAKKLTIRVTSR